MRTKSKSRTGIILVLMGALGVVSQMHFISEDFMLLVVAGMFLGGYFMCGGKKYYKNIWLLISGFTMVAVQAEEYLRDYSLMVGLQDTIRFALLGVAFLLVYVIHSVWYKQLSFGKRNWTIITSIMLFMTSIITFFKEYMNWEGGEIILNNFWPVVLIFAGLFMIVKNHKRSTVQ